MKEEKRFADTGDALVDLATHFIVACHKCDGKATIMKTGDAWKLKCLSCFHTEKPGTWYGESVSYASVKCRECNEPLQRTSSSVNAWKKIQMRCLNCGDECEYDAHVSRMHFHDGMMCDPVFGLPLLLQDRFRDDTFWAYNYDHLDLLEQFISAKLRERGITPRNTIKKNSSMMSRLPSFISKAGNRPELLKMIWELKTK